MIRTRIYEDGLCLSFFSNDKIIQPLLSIEEKRILFDTYLSILEKREREEGMQVSNISIRTPGMQPVVTSATEYGSIKYITDMFDEAEDAPKEVVDKELEQFETFPEETS